MAINLMRDVLAARVHHEWCQSWPCYGPTPKDVERANELMAETTGAVDE